MRTPHAIALTPPEGRHPGRGLGCPALARECPEEGLRAVELRRAGRSCYRLGGRLSVPARSLLGGTGGGPRGWPDSKVPRGLGHATRSGYLCTTVLEGTRPKAATTFGLADVRPEGMGRAGEIHPPRDGAGP